jgi:hypothetical protein
MLSMRRTITLTAVAALVCAAIGVAIAGASSPGRNDHAGVEVIHVVEETPPGGNISLDLDHSGGAPPDTVGDELVFKADLLVGGRKVGFNGGVCKLVGLPALFQCTATDSLPGGELTVQGINDFSQGNGPYHLAITGGTGGYRMARGEVEFLLNTPDADHVQARITIVR